MTAAAVIEPARAADSAAIGALLAAADLPVADLDERFWERFLVLRAAGRVVGAVGLDPAGPVGLLRSLVVAPEVRTRGHGRALVAAVEAAALQRGIVDLYLLTTTAEAFFASLGYQRVERTDAPATIAATAQFAGLCPSSSAFMRKVR